MKDSTARKITRFQQNCKKKLVKIYFELETLYKNEQGIFKLEDGWTCSLLNTQLDAQQIRMGMAAVDCEALQHY